MTARGYPRQSPFAVYVRSDMDDRQARANAAAGEIWHGAGLALVDPEDFPDLIRSAWRTARRRSSVDEADVLSKEELILAACEGKHRQTRQAAKALAKKQRRKKGAAVEAYRCPHCNHWHIGAIEKKPSRSEPPDGRTVKPTPERQKKGEWVWVAMGKNEPKAARDMKSHPIDALAYTKAISHEQASAAYDYEAAYRAALQTPATRDSMTLWEPKGFESDDGNVQAVQRYRKLCRHLGMVRERQMQVVCIEGYMPKRHELGEFRETLNETGRFFGYV